MPLMDVLARGARVAVLVFKQAKSRRVSGGIILSDYWGNAMKIAIATTLVFISSLAFTLTSEARCYQVDGGMVVFVPCP